MTKLIKCSECDREISRKAKICPGCGAKNKQPTSWIIKGFLIFIFIFGVIPAIFSSYQNEGAYSSSYPSQEETPKLSLVNYNCYKDNGYTIVEGQVKNISEQPLKSVQVLAEHYSKDGVFITSDTAMVEYDPIMPGQTSPFKAMARHNPLMSKCSVSFKHIMGGIIPTSM